MSKILEAKKARAAQISKDLESIKTLLDIAPADRQQSHYERAETLLKELEEVNADIRLCGEYTNPAGLDMYGQSDRTRAVNSQIPGVVVANARSQQRAAADDKEAEYRTAFFAYLQGKATPEQRALVTVSTGGAVVPTTTHDEIMAAAQKAQGLLSRVRILEIPGKLSIPVSDINTPAAWHTEGTPIGESNLPPDSINLSGHELAKLFSLSAATQNMSIPAFEAYLIAELVRCNNDALNAAIFAGNGTGQPVGLNTGITWDATNSVTVSADDWTELVKAMALLASNYRQNAAFVMNSTTFYTCLVSQADANGSPIFTKDLTAEAVYRLMGKEVIIDDFAPDNVIFFGNPTYYIFNLSQPMQVARSDEAGFNSGTITYRSLAVVDGAPVPAAFVKITISTD
jgi:HK97 family phage major capsid protein